VAKEVLTIGVETYEELIRDSSRISAQRFQVANEQRGWEFGQKYLLSAQALLQTNAKFRDVYDHFFGLSDRFNALSADSDEVILRKNPGFAQSTGIAEAVRDIKKLQSDFNTFRHDFQETSQKLLGAIEENRTTLQTLDARQRSLIAYLLKKDKAQQEAKENEYRHDAMVNGARSSVFILSTFVSLGGNPRLANQISVLGNSTIELVEAIDRYTTAVNHFGQKDTW